MGTKDMIDFAEKHLNANNLERETERAWIDEKHAMAVKTDRSELINVLRNYSGVDIDRYKKSIESIRSVARVKSKFGVGYVKDILKLMTKISKDAETITIEIGNDSCAIFSLNDSKGVVLEVELAPRMEE